MIYSGCFYARSSFLYSDKFLDFMSALTEALERIFNWLKQHPSDKYASVEVLEPGLTYEEIEERVTELPFRLPKEVYELYQWRNGTCYGEEDFAGFFDGLAFISLESALQKYNELIEYANEWAEKNWCDPNEIWSLNWFPLFYKEVDHEDYYIVICDQEEKETLPVLFRQSEAPELLTQYTSLTNMMLTIAEYYETGAYYVQTDEFERTLESIRYKYNPEADFDYFLK